MLRKSRVIKVLSTMAVVSMLITGAASAAYEVDQTQNPLTDEQIRQLNTVREVTSKYQDVQKAIKDGYIPVGDCVNADDIPPLANKGLGTMGIHYFNPKLVDNHNKQKNLTYKDVLNPNKPELLLYSRDADGNLKLVGVEYMVSHEEWKNINPDLAGLDKEGMELEYLSGPVSYPRPQIFGLEFEGLMGPHGPGEPWHFDKHIWLHSDNPFGVDAQWNPNPDCACHPETQTNDGE